MNIQEEGKSHFPFFPFEHNYNILTLTFRSWTYVAQHAPGWFHYPLLISAQRNGGSLGGNVSFPNIFCWEAGSPGSFAQGIILKPIFYSA